MNIFNLIKKKIFIWIPVVMIVFSGCEKILDVSLNPGKLLQDDIFEEEGTADAAVNGIYASLYNRLVTTGSYFFPSSVLTLYGGLSADELKYGGSATNTAMEFQNNAISPTNSILSFNIWKAAYTDLYHINSCIEGLAISKQLSVNTRNNLLAECYFLRAYFYFNLVNLFGDMPLMSSSDYTNNAQVGRTPRCI